MRFYKIRYLICYNLKAFGCLCFASALTANRKKLDPRARKCAYLGQQPNTKASVLFDMKTRETFVSRHTKFYEQFFPSPVSHLTQVSTNSLKSFCQYMIPFSMISLIMSQQQSSLKLFVPMIKQILKPSLMCQEGPVEQRSYQVTYKTIIAH